MSTAIVSAAVCTDTDTGSYFELAARAGRQALAAAEVAPERVGLVINAGVFRDSNIAEPAVAALIQKRLEVGLEYATGRVPAFSFDLLNGGSGVIHAILTAQCFTGLGDVDYALIVAGDTHPSTRRGREDFPYTASGAALLLHATDAAGVSVASTPPRRVWRARPRGPISTALVSRAKCADRRAGHR